MPRRRYTLTPSYEFWIRLRVIVPVDNFFTHPTKCTTPLNKLSFQKPMIDASRCLSVTIYTQSRRQVCLPRTPSSWVEVNRRIRLSCAAWGKLSSIFSSLCVSERKCVLPVMSVMTTHRVMRATLWVSMFNRIINEKIRRIWGNRSLRISKL